MYRVSNYLCSLHKNVKKKERKEIATLLYHSSVVRTSTRVQGVVERKELPSLLLQSLVVKASTGMEGAMEGKELDTLLLHSSVASASTRVKVWRKERNLPLCCFVVQLLEHPPGCKLQWK